MNPKVDFYFNKEKKWQPEIQRLRTIVLDCGLNEELKWGCPCYTLGGRNIVLIHIFKEYCALLFFKGALLSNEHGILVQQTDNVQSARQVRFTEVQEIDELEPVVKAIIQEAMEAEKAGLKVALKKTAEYAIVPELQQKLNEQPELKAAFDALTPGRQRGYLYHFSQPKQAKTREARIEKCISRIFDGKGFDEE